MPIENEIFRFVTLRKPDPANPGSSGVVTGHVADFHEWIAESLLTSSIVSDLIAVKNANPNSERSHLVDEIKAMQSSALVLTSLQEIEAKFPGFENLLQILKSEGGANVTKAYITNLVKNLTQYEPPHWLSKKNDILQLWESVLVNSIYQPSPEVSDLAIKTLRVLNLFSVLDYQNLDAVYAKALNTQFTLPRSIFPIKKEHWEYTPDTQAQAARAAEINDLKSEITTVQAALDDIQKAVEAELEDFRWAYHSYNIGNIDEEGSQPAPLPFYETGYWNETFTDRLQGSTVTTAETYIPSLKETYRTEFVIIKLEKELQRASKALANYAPGAGSSVMLVNGVILEQTKGNVLQNVPEDIGPYEPPYNPCKVEPIGVAIYRRVEQKLICYKPGEIAHIENVLKSESKTRSTRELRQREEFVYTSEEMFHEEIKDTQTTDRFEVQKESAQVIQNDMQFSAGVNFSATNGAVRVEGSTAFAVQNSKQESAAAASSYAHSVTNRAVQRLMTKTRTDKSLRLFYEFEDKNEHILDNKDGTGHVVGIYRWVDKEYECKVVNYGGRMMFNFLIPEPGAFHIFANTQKSGLTGALEVPIDPKTQGSKLGVDNLLSAADLNQANYLIWAAAYGAEVDPYPALTKIVGKSYFIQAPKDNMESTGGKDDIEIPNGYVAQNARVRFYRGSGPFPANIKILVDMQHIWENASYEASQPVEVPISALETSVPVNYLGFQTASYGFNIDITCTVSPKWIESWQLKTYSAIMMAYAQKKGDYENALAAMQVEAGIYIQGTNPLLLRQYEKMALEKGAIQLLIGEYFGHQIWPAHNPDISDDGGIDAGPLTKHYPWFENCPAIAGGNFVQFFEMAFEWDIMSYNFFPYFWAKHGRWIHHYKVEDADPLFTSFLQAGYAQALVSVRPGFEEMVAHYLETGQIWLGKEKPPLTAQEHIDLMIDVKQQEAGNAGTPDEDIEPWILRVPTNLVILQKDAAGIDVSGLPCDPEGI